MSWPKFLRITLVILSVTLTLGEGKSRKYVAGRRSATRTHEQARSITTNESLKEVLLSYVDLGYMKPSAVSPILNGLQSLTLQSTSLNHDLRTSVNNVFLATSTGLNQSGNGAQLDLVNCLSSIISFGPSLPVGWSCIGMAGRTQSGIKTLMNLILEQYIGILTSKTVGDILDSLDVTLSVFIPPAHQLISHLHNALISVTDSLTGNSVTAIEKAEECFEAVYKLEKRGDESVEGWKGCIESPSSGVIKSIEVGIDGLMEQMIGYLPSNILEELSNILNFHLAYTPFDQLFKDHVESSLSSFVASLNPNLVTAFEKFQSCLNLLLLNHPDSILLPTCIIVQDGPITTLQVPFNLAIQQFSGYLPPILLSTLTKKLADQSLLTRQGSTVTKTMEEIFSGLKISHTLTICYKSLTTCILTVEATGNNCQVDPSKTCSRKFPISRLRL